MPEAEMGLSFPPDFVSAETLALRLDCSRSTIDVYVKAGHLPPPLMIGSLARWDFSEVRAFIKARNEQREGVGMNGRSAAADAYSTGIKLGTATKS